MKEITDLQREMLKKYHLDAMVTMTPENITYVTGAYIPTQVTVRSRKVIHIITEKHDPVVIVVNIEEPIMRAQSWMDPKSIISYNEFTQNPMMIAIDKLKEFGMETKRIGMELSYLSAIDMDLGGLPRIAQDRVASSPSAPTSKRSFTAPSPAPAPA